MIGVQHFKESGFDEITLLQYFENQGYDGVVANKHYWLTVMTLLFWDCIFAKIQGAVVSPDGTRYLKPNEAIYDKLFEFTLSQNGMPQDFYHDNFYSHRFKLFSGRYWELTKLDLAEELLESYSKNKGKSCRTIENWDVFSLEYLLKGIEFIPHNTILRICFFLLRDMHTRQHGITDLTIWNEQEVRFIKMKDKNLSNQEVEFIRFLNLELHEKVDVLVRDQNYVTLAQNYFSGTEQAVKITFIDSVIPKKNEVIQYFMILPEYSSQKEGRNVVHQVILPILDTKNILKALDMVSKWKTSKILVDDEDVSLINFRRSMACYLENLDFWSIDTGKKDLPRYGCKQLVLPPLSSNEWQNYGTIDPTSGTWTTNKQKIHLELEEKITQNKFCPYLNIHKLKQDVDKIRENISPLTDPAWGYRDHNHKEWFYKDGQWKTTGIKKDFPGFEAMVSIYCIDIERTFEIEPVQKIVPCVLKDTMCERMEPVVSVDANRKKEKEVVKVVLQEQQKFEKLRQSTAQTLETTTVKIQKPINFRKKFKPKSKVKARVRLEIKQRVKKKVLEKVRMVIGKRK